ncbi:MAG TPA: KH domain-containing protein [Candidatus Dietzia intestinipullorum]|nr:KH domain-containing protein [Candidatus Dietzia intestinipullorum]
MNDMVVDAVDHLVRGIVSDPDAVSVRTGGGRRGTVIRVAVSPEDLGRVIGRGGRTASAIRTIVTSVAGPDVRVDVVDTDR